MQSFERKSLTRPDLSQDLWDRTLCRDVVYDKQTVRRLSVGRNDISAFSTMRQGWENTRASTLEDLARHPLSLLDLKGMTRHEVEIETHQDQARYRGQDQKNNICLVKLL